MLNTDKNVEIKPDSKNKENVVSINTEIIAGHSENNEISTPEKRVGEIIFLKRCKLRWSQQDLADYANKYNLCYLTQQRISQIEKGAKIFWIEGCVIASAMGLSLDELRP